MRISVFRSLRLVASLILAALAIPSMLCILMCVYPFSDGFFIKRNVRALVAPMFCGLITLACEIDISVQGLDVLDRLSKDKDIVSGNVRQVYLFLHGSNLDANLLCALFRLYHSTLGPSCAVAKRSWVNAPVVGWMFRLLGVVGINRENRGSAIESMHVAETRMRQGYALGVAPEGSRRRSASCGGEVQIQPFKKGPFHVVTNLLRERERRVVVVPILFFGAHAAWPPGQAMCTSGARVTIRVASNYFDFDPREERHSTLTHDELLERIRKRFLEEMKTGSEDPGTEKYDCEWAHRRGTQISMRSIFLLDLLIVSLPSLLALSVLLI